MIEKYDAYLMQHRHWAAFLLQYQFVYNPNGVQNWTTPTEHEIGWWRKSIRQISLHPCSLNIFEECAVLLQNFTNYTFGIFDKEPIVVLIYTTSIKNCRNLNVDPSIIHFEYRMSYIIRRFKTMRLYLYPLFKSTCLKLFEKYIFLLHSVCFYSIHTFIHS